MPEVKVQLELAREIRFLILQDHKENPRKCTAVALEELQGFELRRLGRPRAREEALPLPGGILLEVGAPVLRPEDRRRLAGDRRVVVLDASWARVRALRRRLDRSGRIVDRSLPPWITSAYPRRSKVHEDPGRGLATVEAVFAVTALLGAPRPEVLDGYRWAREFLERNEPLRAAMAESRQDVFLAERSLPP